MFNRYQNSLTLGKLGVSEQHHLPSASGALTFPYNSLSGIMNLKSHYNLAGGRDTRINLPPQVINRNNPDYDYINSYYVDTTDRSTWAGWPGTNYVPLYNNFSRNISVPLKRGDIVILIMFSARGALHVPPTSSVATKNRAWFWNSFNTFTTATGCSLSAFWVRIPDSATDDQLANEYPYITRYDVVANTNMGSSTSVQNVTDGEIFVVRGVPANRSPSLNFSITGPWSNADNNEIAQKTTLQSYGKYNTLYLNYVYTQINLTSSPPDAYPDAIGYIIGSDLYDGYNTFSRGSSSDNSQYETFSTSWWGDNLPRMYSTSPIYNNRKQQHNFNNLTFPAITGYFDVVGSILIEIPY